MDFERDVLGTATNILYAVTITVVVGGFALAMAAIEDRMLRFWFVSWCTGIGIGLLVIGLREREHRFRKLTACLFLWSVLVAGSIEDSSS